MTEEIIDPAAAGEPEELTIEPAVVYEEPVVIPEPIPEPAVEPTPVIVEEAPTPAPEPVVDIQPNPRQRKEPSAAVSGNSKDTVILANCVFKNAYARKSLTVHHVQRRLTELGYNEANADKDGWFGDLTKLATTKFQSDKGLPSTGIMDADTFTKLFEGDNNVEVVL
jgi:peptidoglycan hydrolase-like protein with peptidoglycan-binding domain